jgi:hypothetical protein
MITFSFVLLVFLIMQDNMPSCTLLDGFSRELHSADYSWGISIKSPWAHFINSGVVPRRQLLKSTPYNNLKSTPVASSPAPAAYYMCKLRWNLAVSGPRILATMVPSCTWSSRSVPWVWNPWPRYTSRLRSHLQVHYSGNYTLGLKSMAHVHKSTPVAPSSSLLRQLYLGSEIHGLVLKPTPVAQVDANCRTQTHFGGTSWLRSQS